MTYFISGHTDITERDFQLYYAPVIDRIISQDKNAKFILGNSPGCDTLAIRYLSNKNCSVMVVPWEEEIPELASNIAVNDAKKFNSYEARDAYLTYMSDQDIAFIKADRLDSETAYNLLRRYIIP